jgi:hypothetical protein
VVGQYDRRSPFEAGLQRPSLERRKKNGPLLRAVGPGMLSLAGFVTRIPETLGTCHEGQVAVRVANRATHTTSSQVLFGIPATGAPDVRYVGGAL